MQLADRARLVFSKFRVYPFQALSKSEPLKRRFVFVPHTPTSFQLSITKNKPLFSIQLFLFWADTKIVGQLISRFCLSAVFLRRQARSSALHDSRPKQNTRYLQCGILPHCPLRQITGVLFTCLRKGFNYKASLNRWVCP